MIDTKAELYAMYLISVVVNIHLLNILIYIDTTNNSYINDKVGKCNPLDKCGYHYTPRQYFEDNPWLRENFFFSKHRVFEKKKRKSSHTPTL